VRTKGVATSVTQRTGPRIEKSPRAFCIFLFLFFALFLFPLYNRVIARCAAFVMAKKTRKSVESFSEPLMGDDVQQSIFAIALAAVGAVLVLSFFGLAGNVGVWFDGVLAAVLGIARIIVPVLLFLVAADVVFRDKQLITVRGAVSFALLLIALNGMLNMLFAHGVTRGDALKSAGGAVGLVVSKYLVGAMGSLAAFVIAFAILLVSCVLLFNVSARSLVELPMSLFGGVSFRKKGNDEEQEGEDVLPFDERRKKEEMTEEGDEEDGSAEEAEEEIEEDGETDVPPEKKKPIVFDGNREQVMTTRERRTIEIPVDLLDDKSSEAKSGDIDRGTEVIVKTLQQFGIEVEVEEVRVGPTVTQYALKPPVGVKLSRIVALQNDLALALAAHPIRIEAPIPGKSLVGIEVPNQTIGRVCLRELLESKEFKHRKSSFSVPLGKDITGATQMLMVERAPHMLVAGATGSGKSVCLNDIIISLLYQNGPDDLKFIMVDPKRVELSVYAGIPHLLIPPIVKSDEAINALKWAVREMERRLDHLSKFGAKDIDSYNAKSKERMPRIIVVIDELADLMSQSKRDVEAVIVRIAQMARAAGIHLVLATQRPSVDVITGTIKANIPTRLAFAVASQVDSKTILDVGGAEKLLGRGDMLMSTPELSKPKRAQGAYVAESEIERVVAFLKEESEPDYNYQITEGGNGSGGVALDAADTDTLLDDAIEIAIDAGKVSTSFLQRRMKIGYSRAARIVDLMERLGVVGPADGAKPREVMVSEWPPQNAVEVDEDFDEHAGKGDANHPESEELLDEEQEDENSDEREQELSAQEIESTDIKQREF
jgi:DNA segregation ATPase FtsK/SpoIIIE, S-DNA-T family